MEPQHLSSGPLWMAVQLLASDNTNEIVTVFGKCFTCFTSIDRVDTALISLLSVSLLRPQVAWQFRSHYLSVAPARGMAPLCQCRDFGSKAIALACFLSMSLTQSGSQLQQLTSLILRHIKDRDTSHQARSCTLSAGGRRCCLCLS